MEIPARWTALVLALRDLCPTAVLAGGALRDLDNDRPIKDFDVFIGAQNMTDAEAYMDLLSGNGFGVTFEPGELTCYPEDQNLEVVAVADLAVPEELVAFAGLRALPVQLIFTNWDTARIVERFDYGVCQLSYDGAEVTRGAHYEADKAAKVFQLRRARPTPVSMRGSVKRYARLTAEKYPGWDWAAYKEPFGFADTFSSL